MFTKVFIKKVTETIKKDVSVITRNSKYRYYQQMLSGLNVNLVAAD